MPKILLNADICERTKPTEKLVELVDTHPKAAGLSLRVTPAGAKTWCVRYRLPVTGERRRENLGAYPALSLSLAREKALALATKLVMGGDPRAEKAAAIRAAENRKMRTVEGVAAEYFPAAVKGRHRKGGKPKRESALKLERYYWERFLAPKFGKWVIDDLKRADIQRFIDPLPPSSARQCRATLQRIFTYARLRELILVDPTEFVEADHWISRERVFDEGEMLAIWSALNRPDFLAKIGVNLVLADALKLCALTLQRRAEVAAMRMPEIDLEARTWTIPGLKTKNKRTHVVPLSDAAIEIILARKSALNETDGYLFPTTRGERKSVSPTTLTRAFIEVVGRLEIQNARLHDLRRTGATMLTSERLGVPRFTVSKVLNHASDHGGAPVVTSVYDRNDHLPQKRKALDLWAAEVLRLYEQAQ